MERYVDEIVVTTGIALLLLLFLLPLSAVAQPDTSQPSGSPSPFLLSGYSTLFGQLADRQGTFQYTPEDLARWEFNPTLSFHGIPFSASVLLTTEQSDVRQKINSVAFGFDYQRLENALMERAYDRLMEMKDVQAAVETAGGTERLYDSLQGLGESAKAEMERLMEYTDLEKVRERAVSESVEQLESLGLISTAEKFFLNLPSLQFGVTYPRYTELTLGSVPVNGGNIEWNPGKFYIAAAGGTTQRAIRLPGIRDSIIAGESFERSLYAGRIGFGRKEGSHFIITLLHASDDAATLPFDSLSLGGPITPVRNYVLGIDINVPLVEDMLAVDVEAAGSLLTADQRAAEFDENDVPEFIADMVDPNLSSFADYAITGSTKLRIPETETRAQGSVRYIGPGFVSLGAPVLRSDQLRYDAKVEQKFWRRQITLIGQLRNERDNLIGNKSGTTTVNSFGLGVGLNIVKLPYLRLFYSPYVQELDDTLFSYRTRTTSLTASTGYTYRLLDLTASTMISLQSQQSRTGVLGSDYGVTTIMGNQSVTFRFPLTLSGGVTVSELSDATSASSTLLSLDIAGYYTAFDTWHSGLGLTYSRETGRDSNLGFFAETSVPLWDHGTFQLRAARTLYRNVIERIEDFEEVLFTAMVTTRW
jgi:hypothetical protein